MTSNLDELAAVLAEEIEKLSQGDADRLCGILRGLFGCLSEMNRRVAALEEESLKSPPPSG